MVCLLYTASNKQYSLQFLQQCYEFARGVFNDAASSWNNIVYSN
jgi:hypothetical protein